jgi:hypothetical protein
MKDFAIVKIPAALMEKGVGQDIIKAVKETTGLECLCVSHEFEINLGEQAEKELKHVEAIIKRFRRKVGRPEDVPHSHYWNEGGTFEHSHKSGGVPHGHNGAKYGLPNEAGTKLERS